LIEYGSQHASMESTRHQCSFFLDRVQGAEREKEAAVIAGPHTHSGVRSILVRAGPLSSALWQVHLQSSADGWEWGEERFVVTGVVNAEGGIIPVSDPLLF
jgi:hypothetical protein